MATYEDLMAEARSHATAAQEIAKRAKARPDGDFIDNESEQVEQLMAKAVDCRTRAEKSKADAAVMSSIARFGDELGHAEKAGGELVTDSRGIPTVRGKSIGQQYVDSGQFKELMEQRVHGDFLQGQRIRSHPAEFKSLVRPHQKSLITGASDTSGGAFLRGDDLGLVVGMEPFQRPLTLRSLVTNGTTTSDAIEFVRVTSITNNAAPVPEATSAAAPTAPGSAGALVLNANGGYKPESGLAVARYSTNVKTIAHWVPVTKRALADAAQMVSLIDGFLEYGLEEELEDQMIAGNGSGENFEGLASVSGVQTQSSVADPSGRPAGFGRLLALRRAKTKVLLNGRSTPNGYVLNPADVETLDEVATGMDQFYFGGPSGANGTSPLWGLPVIQSEAVPVGTAYCADWTRAVLWDRQQATITTTDSHMDFFTRNLVVVLAELRAAWAVLQPSAFVKVTL
jgi:HK97 family phage major capsid protein